MSTLTIDEFESLSDFIYRKTGIRFESKKIYYISKRLEKRMEILGIDNIADYIRELRFNDHKGNEFHNLVDLLTVNETYFFRDFPQLQVFAENCLEEVANRKAAKGDYNLRIWSAACSSGEEPYTIGIILLEMLENYRMWNIELIASDIDRQILKKAKAGIYRQRSVRDVPPEYLEKYFEHSGDEYKISNKVKQIITFENINLADRETIRHHMNFDFVFCRNLLIYFDDVSRKKMVDQFYVALNSGGYIFLGSSESVGRISTAFRLKKVNGHLVYYK